MISFTTWILSALSIVITAFVLPGVEATVVGALIATIVLTVLNTFIKPLIVFLTLPINVLTLGLFTLVINACIVMLVGFIVPGFGVSGFITALLFSLVLAVVQLCIFSIIRKN
jgi:putative membrane protein